MMHEIYSLWTVALVARGCPLQTVYGPKPVPLAVGGSRIQMTRDYEADDAMLPTRSQRQNPKQYGILGLNGIVRVFAHSTIAGAQIHNHERLAEKAFAMAHCELVKVVHHAKTVLHVVRVGYAKSLLDAPDGWAGVIYEYRFQVERGLQDLDWLEAADTEGTYAHSATTLDTTDSPNPAKTLPSATTRIE